MIFPSLGPTAYLLAFDNKISHSFKVVGGGHLCGIAGGLLSYWLLVNPYTLSNLAFASSEAGLLLGTGAVLSIVITVFLMLWLNVSHPPACATTLIVSLGIMPHWSESVIILGTVAVMYGIYFLTQKQINR